MAFVVRVIGVLDLLGGYAVHAQAGQRAHYAPIEAVAGQPVETGDALALARAYVDRFNIKELYAADLDAILGKPLQKVLVTQLAGLDFPLWLDAGVSSTERARSVVDIGATHVVVGLETLSSFDILQNICAVVGGDRIAFSLDLRNGEPIISPSAPNNLHDETAIQVATRAVGAGVGSIIVIDLARVGTRKGLDLELISHLRDATKQATLVVGGGISGPEDLTRLAATGCDAALVATALHNGWLGATEISGAD